MAKARKRVFPSGSQLDAATSLRIEATHLSGICPVEVGALEVGDAFVYVRKAGNYRLSTDVFRVVEEPMSPSDLRLLHALEDDIKATTEYEPIMAKRAIERLLKSKQDYTRRAKSLYGQQVIIMPCKGDGSVVNEQTGKVVGGLRYALKSGRPEVFSLSSITPVVLPEYPSYT